MGGSVNAAVHLCFVWGCSWEVPSSSELSTTEGVRELTSGIEVASSESEATVVVARASGWQADGRFPHLASNRCCNGE